MAAQHCDYQGEDVVYFKCYVHINNSAFDQYENAYKTVCRSVTTTKVYFNQNFDVRKIAVTIELQKYCYP